MADTTNGLADFCIGCIVKLKTVFDEDIQGAIFAYDQPTNTVVIKQAGAHGGVCNIRWVKANYIKEILLAEQPQDNVSLDLPRVDAQRVQEREQKALQQAREEADKVGSGVTKEAQSIFDALSRTMPCRWDDKNIVVLEEVYVAPPYQLQSCTSSAQKSTLDRVKKVLAMERHRLGLAVEDST